MPTSVKFLFLSLSILLLSSCANPPSDAIRFGLSNKPVTLDPRFATDAASSRINRLIYSRLVDFDIASKPIPAIATWNKLTPLHYQFLLGAKGRTFDNGMPLTAKDVKVTYDFILDKNNASPHRLSLTHINKIEISDENTIDFHLNKPDPLFPGRLIIGILPEQLIRDGHKFNRIPVGSGPYRLKAWPDDVRLILTRASDGQLLEFIHVPDPTVRVLKLLRGEIDMLQNDLPPELVTYLEKNDDVKILKGKGSNFSYLGFNFNDPIVGHINVRKAIAHAIDRQALIKYVLGNAARPAAALLPPDHWAGHATLSAYKYDPVESKRLLKAVSLTNGKPLQITYKTSSDPFRLRIATIIQQQLGEVGIEIDLRSYDWGTFYGDIKAGNFQMYSLIWVGIKNPDIFRYVFHSESIPPDGANRGRLTDQIVDNLIDTAEASESINDQAGYYRELQSYLLEQMPYVPLWYEDHVFIARKGIEGYRIASDGNYDGLIHIRRE